MVELLVIANTAVPAQSPQRQYYVRYPPPILLYSSPRCQMTEVFAKARWLYSWGFYTCCLPLKLALFELDLQASDVGGETDLLRGVRLAI